MAGRRIDARRAENAELRILGSDGDDCFRAGLNVHHFERRAGIVAGDSGEVLPDRRGHAQENIIAEGVDAGDVALPDSRAAGLGSKFTLPKD